MASYEELDDEYPEGDAGGESAETEEDDDENGGEDGEETANPESIRFGWGEMVFLFLIVFGSESLGLALLLIPYVGFILKAGVNFGVSAFQFFWLYFIKRSTGHRWIKKALIKTAVGLLGAEVEIPYIQTIILLWIFLDARSESIHLATQLAEKAYAKFK